MLSTAGGGSIGLSAGGGGFDLPILPPNLFSSETTCKHITGLNQKL